MTPVVFLPNLLGDGAMWQHQFSFLKDIAECSAADVARHDRMDALAREVLETAPPEFGLVGLSFGGFVAMEVMRQAPERVLKLCLIDTTARPESQAQKDYRQGQLARAANGQYDHVISGMLPMLISQLRDTNLVHTITTMAHRVGRHSFCNRVKALIDRVDSRPLLPTIRCPVHVIAGLQDAITPPDIQEEMVDSIPKARLALIPDCGHLSPVERPEVVTRLLRNWLLC
jgi:pimeloyl-ACP methyl ester carboxylesterase